MNSKAGVDALRLKVDATELQSTLDAISTEVSAELNRMQVRRSLSSRSMLCFRRPTSLVPLRNTLMLHGARSCTLHICRISQRALVHAEQSASHLQSTLVSLDQKTTVCLKFVDWYSDAAAGKSSRC